MVFFCSGISVVLFDLKPEFTHTFKSKYFSGFNMTAEMLKTTEGTVLAYHRITEAFKFAYAKRTGLGDPKFIDIERVNY